MRLIIYLLQPAALLYLAMRFAWFADSLIVIFAAGSIFLIGYSIRRHWQSNHLA